MLNCNQVFVAMVALAVLGGCQSETPGPGGQSGRALPGRADQGASLLTAAVAQWNDLPSYVDTQLRRPAVILDSRKSSDGDDVAAIAAVNRKSPDGPIFLVSSSRNGQFKRLRVRPGDVVKYYVVEDESVDEESRQRGLSRPKAMDLTVAQVLDDNILLVERGSEPVPLETPAKMEIWRFLDDRLVEIGQRLKKYAERRLPELDWEPSPDRQALTQIVDRLNQWSRQSNPKADWQLDSLFESLDSPLRANQKIASRLSAEALAAPEFESYDGRLLQEAIWLRDISRWASGNEFEDVGRANALFDWTIRNVQLDAAGAGPRRPWQVLLHGRGTAQQRAWVFALLCRQQGLDVVILEPTAETCWPALWADGQLYLFDTRLGLPIPGPDGEGIATLEQLRAEANLLRRLDLDDMPYAVNADQLQHLVANVVADQFDLSRRARQLERRLTGDDRVALTTSPSEWADRLKSAQGIDKVALWSVPFQVLHDQLELGKRDRTAEAKAFEPFAWRPQLWQARVLHFQGRVGPAGGARTADANEFIDDHRKAAQFYASKQVRPAARDIARLSEERQPIDRASRLNAAYWVGLMLFDDGKVDVAIQWLGRPELLADDSPWSAGASYNLARAYEKLDKIDEAIALYKADTSPQRHGNRLRAKRLREPR